MNEFNLEILTPEKRFFSGMVEATVCPTSTGDIEILKGHQNLVAALSEDEIKLKINGEWKIAVVSSGFFEVRADKVVVFAKYCDDIEDYEKAKKNREEIRQKEKESYHENVSTLRRADISLSKFIISSHKRNKNINFK